MFEELLVITYALSLSTFSAAQNVVVVRPRAAELGIKVGVLPAGPLDAITDVGGVEVGHTTVIRGENIRTGVTAILPHAGNLYREKVPAGIFVGNGFGKLAGSTQVGEMGDFGTPILLTSTTSSQHKCSDYSPHDCGWNAKVFESEKERL